MSIVRTSPEVGRYLSLHYPDTKLPVNTGLGLSPLYVLHKGNVCVPSGPGLLLRGGSSSRHPRADGESTVSVGLFVSPEW